MSLQEESIIFGRRRLGRYSLTSLGSSLVDYIHSSRFEQQFGYLSSKSGDLYRMNAKEFPEVGEANNLDRKIEEIRPVLGSSSNYSSVGYREAIWNVLKEKELSDDRRHLTELPLRRGKRRSLVENQVPKQHQTSSTKMTPGSGSLLSFDSIGSGDGPVVSRSRRALTSLASFPYPTVMMSSATVDPFKIIFKNNDPIAKSQEVQTEERGFIDVDEESEDDVMQVPVVGVIGPHTHYFDRRV
jgi:hypothetical protein